MESLPIALFWISSSQSTDLWSFAQNMQTGGRKHVLVPWDVLGFVCTGLRFVVLPFNHSVTDVFRFSQQWQGDFVGSVEVDYVYVLSCESCESFSWLDFLAFCGFEPVLFQVVQYISDVDISQSM